MIVKEVRGKDKLLVIHYYSDTGKGDTAAIAEREYITDHEKVYLIEYDPSKFDKVYTGEEAVARAEGRCGTGQGEYDLIFNNCEHFCTFVKTDKKESQQVQRAVKVVGAAAALGLGIGTVIYLLYKPKESEKSPASKPSDSQ